MIKNFSCFYKKTYIIIDIIHHKMNIWLSKQANNLHMLTLLKPVVATVHNSNYKDLYIQPGEPFGLRNLCSTILILLNQDNTLGRLESREIDITDCTAEFWITRQNNGLYMITYNLPVIENVMGTEVKDVYITAGEPIGIRNISEKILMFSEHKGRIKRLESVYLKLSGLLGHATGQ